MLASSVNLSQPQPAFLVQKSTNVRLPKGRIQLFTIKSSRSSTTLSSIPKGWKPESTLNMDLIYERSQGKSWILLTPRIGEPVLPYKEQLFDTWWR